MRLLEQKKIPYIRHEYDAAGGAKDGITVAGMIGKPPYQVFKTLVTRGASKENYVFVIPVETELDLKKAAKAVAEKAIEMVRQAELLPLTGYVHGGCSPLGMKKQLKTVLDEEVLLLDTVIVSAGKIGYQIAIAPQELIALTNAFTADVTVS